MPDLLAHGFAHGWPDPPCVKPCLSSTRPRHVCDLPSLRRQFYKVMHLDMLTAVMTAVMTPVMAAVMSKQTHVCCAAD